MNTGANPGVNKMLLAADVGGTNIRAALVDSEGRIHLEMRQQLQLSRPGLGKQDIIQALDDCMRPMLAKHPEVAAIGIGFPGFFRGNSGILAASPNIPALREFPLSDHITQRLNRPCLAQNDALCAAMGEHAFGAGRGHHNLLHLTLGTGIGGGLILAGQPYTGESGMAMEFGHLRIEHGPHARLCGCGGRGCVEAYASATGLAATYRQLSGEILSGREISTLADNNDSQAMRAFELAGNHLGRAIAEAIKLLDVHTVTISGGPTGAWNFLYPSLMQNLNEHLIPPLRGSIAVRKSSLADRAGILGAAVCALRAQN